MKKCPNCEEDMIIIRKDVRKKMTFGDMILVVLFFPISLLFLALEINDSKQEKQYFYCPNCNYNKEVDFDKKPEKKERTKAKFNIKRFGIFLFILAFIVLVVTGIFLLVK